jgi:leucyl/phenylalanyl-tRNA--protein transferase
MQGQNERTMPLRQSLPWLDPGEAFPPVEHSWPASSAAPGLLAAGGDLSTSTLVRAYSNGIFPWFSHGDPILWWSTDPRMVLDVANFRLHRSLRKTLQAFISHPGSEVRIDSDFRQVIAACADAPRPGQSGTWISEEMQEAYHQLHAAGYAHSVETWVNGELAGGLYLVAIGRAIFGESMFARAPDASKIALAALVALLRACGVNRIDCQQNTRHLASLGATEIPRSVFLEGVRVDREQTPPVWRFVPLYWTEILGTRQHQAPIRNREADLT